MYSALNGNLSWFVRIRLVFQCCLVLFKPEFVRAFCFRHIGAFWCPNCFKVAFTALPRLKFCKRTLCEWAAASRASLLIFSFLSRFHCSWVPLATIGDNHFLRVCNKFRFFPSICRFPHLCLHADLICVLAGEVGMFWSVFPPPFILAFLPQPRVASTSDLLPDTSCFLPGVFVNSPSACLLLSLPALSSRCFFIPPRVHSFSSSFCLFLFLQAFLFLRPFFLQSSFSVPLPNCLFCFMHIDHPFHNSEVVVNNEGWLIENPNVGAWVFLSFYFWFHWNKEDAGTHWRVQAGSFVRQEKQTHPHSQSGTPRKLKNIAWVVQGIKCKQLQHGFCKQRLNTGSLLQFHFFRQTSQGSGSHRVTHIASNLASPTLACQAKLRRESNCRHFASFDITTHADFRIADQHRRIFAGAFVALFLWIQSNLRGFSLR